MSRCKACDSALSEQEIRTYAPTDEYGKILPSRMENLCSKCLYWVYVALHDLNTDGVKALPPELGGTDEEVDEARGMDTFSS